MVTYVVGRRAGLMRRQRYGNVCSSTPISNTLEQHQPQDDVKATRPRGVKTPCKVVFGDGPALSVGGGLPSLLQGFIIHAREPAPLLFQYIYIYI
jgi:hypothetical protein